MVFQENHCQKSEQKPSNKAKSDAQSRKRKKGSLPSILKHFNSTSSEASTTTGKEEDQDKLMRDGESDPAEGGKAAAEEKEYFKRTPIPVPVMVVQFLSMRKIRTNYYKMLGVKLHNTLQQKKRIFLNPLPPAWEFGRGE